MKVGNEPPYWTLERKILILVPVGIILVPAVLSYFDLIRGF